MVVLACRREDRRAAVHLLGDNLGTVSVVSCLCLAALRITTALRPCAAARLHALAQTRAARTRAF